MEQQQSAEVAHASKGGAETTTPAQAVVEILRHPPHSYQGVAPNEDSIIVVDPGVRNV